MLTFFIDPYKDEIISSLFARYHFYSGNIDKNDTIEELQGERNIIAFRNFPSRLNYLEKEIDNKNYSADKFIYENTLFPMYSVFLSKDKHNTIIKYMKEKESDKIYTSLAISRSKVDMGNGYKYCPMCAKKELELYGEAYFHRIHQVPGVLVCDEHECSLVEYVEENKSEIEFVRLQYDKLQFDDYNKIYEQNINMHLVKIAKAIKYIMNLEYLKYNKEYIIEKIYYLLEDNEYLTENGRIRQTKLKNHFNLYYNNNLLKVINSEVQSKKNNWIKAIFTKGRMVLEPIKTILLILFLCEGDIEGFFNYRKKDRNCFVEGPWPCLNPVCKYYKMDVINTIKIKNAYKSRLENAIFKCEICGYEYRRKGPDQNSYDKYKKDKVLDFGEVWEKAFKDAVNSKMKKKDIIVKFEVYDKFIDYYRESNRIICRDYKTNLGNRKNNFEEYSNNLIEYMKNNKGCLRTNIIENNRKEAGWLRDNYPEWLEQNLPQAIKSKGYSKKRDLSKIDCEILEDVKFAYNKIITNKKPKRVTITLIEAMLNKKIGRNLDRLKRTKEYLNTLLEDVDKYSIRRITSYCEQLINNDKYVSKSHVIKNTAISYSLVSDTCKIEINKIIDEYHIKIIKEHK